MTSEGGAVDAAEPPMSVGGRAGNVPVLRALGLYAAAVVSPITVLLFRRAEIAERLDLLGAIVGESVLIGVVLLVVCWRVPNLRDRLPAVMVLMLGGLLASVGLALMAWTIELNLFVIGGVFWAVGVAPALVTVRLLLVTDREPADRFRAMSWFWAAVAVGAGWPLGLRILADVSYGTVVWICFVLLLVASLAVGPHALVHDEDHEVEDTVARLDVPWARRAIGAAFGGGAVVIGGADPAQALLLGEWQRSGTQNAAVLAAGAGAAAAICAFGPWYHRLHRLQAGRRADAIGIQLLIAGVLVFLGGLSFTYIGLIVCWVVAGGAMGLAAAGLDAAAFTPIAASLRRTLAWRQVRAAALGGALAAAVNAWVIGGWSDQWKIAWTGLPLAAVGWMIRRYAASSRDAEIVRTEAAATTVPRRVLDPDDGPIPLLSVEKVSVAYGSVQVLFDLDLTVEEGQVVALLGTNGAGKTTLLRAISGLEPIVSGRIVYAGLNITRTRPTWRVGMGLHQIVGGEAVVGPLTVDENLRLFCHGVPAERIEAGLAEVAELFPRLAERRNQQAATLSGGEKQMLALAKAVIVQPRLLLIDEFSLGLAPTVIADLLPVVRRIADAGASVLLVEQSVNIALSVADHAYVIEKGEIGWSGPAAELREQPDLLRSAYLEGLAQALSSVDGGAPAPGTSTGSGDA